MTKMEFEIKQQPEFLKSSLDFNMPVLIKLVNALKERKPKGIYLAARGTSDHAGIYFKYIEEALIGIPVALAAPSVITLYGGKPDFSDYLVIGISQSGAAEDVNAVINRAKECGAVTLTITNTLGSLLAKNADYHLYCNVEKEESVAATKTFGSDLYLIANFVAMWSDNKEFLEQLNLVPNIMDAVVNRNNEIKELARRYRFMTECFMLARGNAYPIALESCLKVQETNYVKAKAYPISDFHHGPFAMIDDGMPVFVYAADGPANKDTVEMINKVRNAGGDVLVISDNVDFCQMGDSSFLIENCPNNDMISVFAFTVFAQLFACNLAAVKGRNPDSPRGLKKVTITK